MNDVYFNVQNPWQFKMYLYIHKYINQFEVSVCNVKYQLINTCKFK